VVQPTLRATRGLASRRGCDYPEHTAARRSLLRVCSSPAPSLHTSCPEIAGQRQEEGQDLPAKLADPNADML
jgi:hypothetical protein